MPKELTHWILAQRSVEALGEGSGLKKVIRNHRDLYLAGAVLPDTLMHLFRGPNAAVALDLAHRFHDAPDNSYRPLADAEARYPEGLSPPLLSCLLGVISHIQADVALHPYVFSLTEKEGIGAHYRLETAIDGEFLRQGERPPARRMAELVTPASQVVLVQAMGEVFDPEEKLSREVHRQALALHCRLQGMYDRLHWKLFAGIAGRILGPPFSNQRHLFYPVFALAKADEKPSEWEHPATGERRTESVEELSGQAVRQTVAVFDRIEREGFSTALRSSPGANLLSGRHPA